MKSTLALLSLLTLGTAAGAAELPNQTLYIKPTSLERAGVRAEDGAAVTYTAYVAYTSDPTNATDSHGPWGMATQAMTEDVAVTLKNMSVGHVYKCDAHALQNLNQLAVFQLHNCK